MIQDIRICTSIASIFIKLVRAGAWVVELASRLKTAKHDPSQHQSNISTHRQAANIAAPRWRFCTKSTTVKGRIILAPRLTPDDKLESWLRDFIYYPLFDRSDVHSPIAAVAPRLFADDLSLYVVLSISHPAPTLARHYAGLAGSACSGPGTAIGSFALR